MDRKLLQREFAKRQKRVQQRFVDWIFVGDGREQGVAYNHAKQCPQERLIVVEPVSLNYSLLSNMVHIQRDIINYLQNLPLECVGNVRDDFAFESVTMRAFGSDEVGQYRRHVEIYQAILVAQMNKTRVPKGVPDFHRNGGVYVGLVKRVLRKGGRFVLTTSNTPGGQQNQELIAKVLEERGFEVSVDRLGKDDLQYESRQASHSFQEGLDVYRITGLKS